MLGKLISLLAHAKGAVGVTILVASAATVAATNPDVQTTVTNVTSSISTTLSSVTMSTRSCSDETGQPAVVAQRNAADKLLRDAWGTDHRALENLRGGKNVDNKAAGDIVQKYDGQLKDRLDKALNDVAALTLGRDGQVRKAEASASPDATRSPKPSCSPTPALASPVAATTPNESPKADGSGKPEDAGRVAVAERTTLDTDVQTLVTTSIKDMDDFVRSAMDEAVKLPALERKPSDNPGNKPSGSPRG